MSPSRPPEPPKAGAAWSASVSCPQCGGLVALEVGDPILSCPYCRTNLYLSPGRPLCYRLAAPEGAAPAPDLHLPFWRVRGLRYRALAEPAGIEGNLLDATVPAWAGAPPEANLGVRPQAVRMALVAGPEVSPSVVAEEAVAAAERRVEELVPARSLFSRLIGERWSLIEAPFVLDRGAGGARLREALPDAASYALTEEAAQALGALPLTAPGGATLRFLALLCPECGHGLPAAPGSAAFLCGQCARAWRVTSEGFASLPAVGCEPAPGERLLPFWRLRFSAEGLPFATRAELRRWAVSYQPVPAGWADEPATLLLPGFKTHPRALLQVSRALSLASLPEVRPLSPGRPFEAEPVRLPVAEAAQALKLVLAHLVESQPRAYPAVSQARLRVSSAELLVLPFLRRGAEWLHRPSGFALQRSALERGAGL